MNAFKAMFCGALALVVAMPAAADELADFFRGKRITLYIGSSSGGGTDAYGRIVAQNIGRHVPGQPAVIASNKPGANGLVLVNQLYQVLPKDGTAMGTFDRNAALHAIWGNPRAAFDPKEMNWIGSTNIDVSTCVTWAASGIDTLEKFMTGEIALGSTAVYHANMLNELFGARLKQVTGYRGGNEVVLALERGEVQGRCNWSWSSVISTRKEWVTDKKINVIIQFAEEKHPDLPNVPLIGSLAKTDRDRQMLALMLSSQTMARPFAAPPKVPADRVAALRNAFLAMAKDPAFLKSAQQQALEVEPVSGERIQKIIEDIAKTPKDVVRALRDVAMGKEASARWDKKKSR